MALRDVLKDAVYLAKTPISDADFIRHYNACLRELQMQRDTAKRVVDVTVTVSVPGEWHALSASCMGVRRVEDSDGEYVPSRHWRTRDWSEISIDLYGTFTVTELQEHPAITTLAATETIHRAYRDAIARYIASKCAAEGRSDLVVAYKDAADMADYAIRRTRGKNAQVYTDPYM